MPIDVKLLEAAEALLNAKLDKVRFRIDLKTNSLVTDNFDITNKELYIFAPLADTEVEIRNSASGSNFKSFNNCVHFNPAFPDASIETQKTIVYAQISDESSLRELAILKYMQDFNNSLRQAFQKCAPADQMSDLAAKVAGLQAENANLKGVLRDTLLILDQLRNDHNDLKQQFAAQMQKQQDPHAKFGSVTVGAPVYRDSPIASNQTNAPQAAPTNAPRPATAP